MIKTTALRALFAGAGVAAAGSMGMAVAAADDGAQQADLGGAAQLVDGGTVQQWTVAGLRPSADSIGYAPAGSLWEATATNTSVQGGNVPFVPGFAARGGADNYPVLWGVASPQGVNPSGLAPGQSSTGKLYFDVTGASPDRVAFSGDGRDLAVWVTPPPPAASGGGAPAATYSPPMNYGVTPSAPAAAAPSAPAPAAAPAPATGSQGTPLPATGSQGTPLPATGSQGTPLPAGATPAPASTAPATTPAPASQAPAAASQAPASTPAPASQAPASSSTAAPAPASGSQGTPLTAPTTTVVPTPGT